MPVQRKFNSNVGPALSPYRVHLDRGYGRNRRKGFTETGYARPLDAARQQRHGCGCR